MIWQIHCRWFWQSLEGSFPLCLASASSKWLLYGHKWSPGSTEIRKSEFGHHSQNSIPRASPMAIAAPRGAEALTPRSNRPQRHWKTILFIHCMTHELSWKTMAQETMAQGTQQYTPSQICRSKAADKAFFSRNLCRSRQKSWQSCRLLWRRLWNLLIYQRSSWDILRHIKTVDVTSKLWIDTDSITAMRKSAR